MRAAWLTRDASALTGNLFPGRTRMSHGCEHSLWAPVRDIFGVQEHLVASGPIADNMYTGSLYFAREASALTGDLLSGVRRMRVGPQHLVDRA